MSLFNINVRGALDRYLVAPYVLKREGAQAIVRSNENLAEEYFAHLEFPVSDFQFGYFASKIATVPPRK